MRPQITKHVICKPYSRIFECLGHDNVYFRLFILRDSTRCSAGSEINFLDKKSETCQNIMQLYRNLSCENKIGKSQKSKIKTHFCRFGIISYKIPRIFDFHILVFALGALRDLRLFSWTNNLRLVKNNCSSPEVCAIARKSENSRYTTFSDSLLFVSGLGVSLCLCVSVSLCLCVSVSLCLCVSMSLRLYVSVSLCLYVSVSLCLCSTVGLCVCACEYLNRPMRRCVLDSA